MYVYGSIYSLTDIQESKKNLLFIFILFFRNYEFV